MQVKPITKAEFYKLKPGAIVEVIWNDAPPKVGILLDKPERAIGEVSVDVLVPADGRKYWVVNPQIVAVHAPLVMPEPKTPATHRITHNGLPLAR